MTKKTILAALLVCMAVLCATAQKTKNSNCPSGTIAEGNGNVVTRDFKVAEFDEISLVLPATVNFTVADHYSCCVTLDENLFEYLDIRVKAGCLDLKKQKKEAQINLSPTKFIIELSAPTLEDISLVGGGDINFLTPFEARKLDISVAGANCVYFNETATVRDFKMNLAGAGKLVCQDLHADNLDLSIAGVGKLVCKNLHADHADLDVAGLGDIVIEAGVLKSADVSVAGAGSVETRCQLESMDYSIAGAGTIRYYGDVKLNGSTIGGGKIRRMDK